MKPWRTFSPGKIIKLTPVRITVALLVLVVLLVMVAAPAGTSNGAPNSIIGASGISAPNRAGYNSGNEAASLVQPRTNWPSHHPVTCSSNCSTVIDRVIRITPSTGAPTPVNNPTGSPVPVPSGSFNILSLTPQQQAWYLLPNSQRTSAEYGCLSNVVRTESNWNKYARNPSSGAYGIPQALPGYKMNVLVYVYDNNGNVVNSYRGNDWATSSYTQLYWMERVYIPHVYGDPCSAWYHEQRYNWY